MDTVTSSQYMEFELGFADGDTRLLTLDDLNTGIDSAGASLAARVKALNQNLLSTQAFIGDRKGAAFTGLNYARKINKTVAKLDIS